MDAQLRKVVMKLADNIETIANSISSIETYLKEHKDHLGDNDEMVQKNNIEIVSHLRDIQEAVSQEQVDAVLNTVIKKSIKNDKVN